MSDGMHCYYCGGGSCFCICSRCNCELGRAKRDAVVWAQPMRWMNDQPYCSRECADQDKLALTGERSGT